MPKDKDRKRLVRHRMVTTGERYTEALQALLGGGDRRENHDPFRRQVELLGSPEHNTSAFAMLKGLPPEELRPLAIAGLRHPDARVRRRCCRLLDDLALTADSAKAMSAAMDDPDPHVRAAALHSLTCVHCKPDACALDERALFERGARDPSPVVRGAVLAPITWRADLVAPWVVALLQDARRQETSSKLLALADRGLLRIRDQLARDSAWRTLPDPLRSVVGRHQGKWVVVSDGRVVSAHRSRGQAAKQARGVRGTRRADPGTGLAGAQMYWVSPERP